MTRKKRRKKKFHLEKLFTVKCREGAEVAEVTLTLLRNPLKCTFLRRHRGKGRERQGETLKAKSSQTVLKARHCSTETRQIFNQEDQCEIGEYRRRPYLHTRASERQSLQNSCSLSRKDDFIVHLQLFVLEAAALNPCGDLQAICFAFSIQIADLLTELKLCITQKSYFIRV